MADVRLTVNGRRFEGWEEVEAVKSLEAVAAGFSLTVSDRDPWPIVPGDACVLALDGETVVEGFVDRLGIDLAADGHTVTVAGRDRAGDLVDCSVIHPTGEFINQTILQIAGTLCAPFGVRVSADAPPGGPFAKFSVQPGETAWSAIERLARQRGLLAVGDAAGGVVLTRPKAGRTPVALVEGKNVKAAAARFDDSQRFSRYVVRGQSAGTDDFNGEAAAAVNGVATDPGVTRNRPLVVLGEGNLTAGQAQERARYEATVRAARAGRVSVTVQGWRTAAAGDLWVVNRLVAVDLPTLRIRGDMLVGDVSFRRSNAGTVTELGLVRPDGFAVEPVAANGDAVPTKGGSWDDLFKGAS